jgi:hypothetical protein
MMKRTNLFMIEIGNPTNPRKLGRLFRQLVRLSSTNTVISDNFLVPFFFLIIIIFVIDWLSWRDTKSWHKTQENKIEKQ